MQDKSRFNRGLQLSFKASCFEINELHLTFNKAAKTMNLATQCWKDQKGEEHLAQALLNYAEAYKIFEEFDPNHKHKGVCLANIGSILSQKGEFLKA